MKKLFLIQFFCVFLLVFSSCRVQNYGILSYQEKAIDAECTLNGEYKISIRKHGSEKKICFSEPSALSHISFEIVGENVTARAGEVEIQLEPETVRGILALSNVFSLNEGALSTAGALGERSNMEFQTEYGTYTLTLGKNGLPSRVQIYSAHYRYDISVDAIKLS